MDADFNTVLIYGLGLFFIFAVLVLYALRYSNQQLLKKINEFKQQTAEEMAKVDKEMRKLVLINSRERQELMAELEKLKVEPKKESAKTPKVALVEEEKKKVKIVA